MTGFFSHLLQNNLKQYILDDTYHNWVHVRLFHSKREHLEAFTQMGGLVNCTHGSSFIRVDTLTELNTREEKRK